MTLLFSNLTQPPTYSHAKFGGRGGGQFSWGHFSGENFLGAFFRGGFSPGGIFLGTLLNIFSLKQILKIRNT